MSLNEWIALMYVVALAGAFVGLMYPTAVAWFQETKPKPRYFNTNAGGLGRWILFLSLGLFIAAVLVTLGFAGFLGSPENQQNLKDAGFVTYLLAFGFGFGSASLIEEPLKK